MANFSKTISNSINTFAGGPSSLWNSYNWGAFRWGEGTADIIHLIVHLISESQSVSDSLAGFAVTHTLATETLSPTSETTSEQLQDGSGYTYIFVSNASDAENRDDAVWASGAANSQSWSSASVASTSWS